MNQNKVSIIILTWNKLAYTKKCLKFLEKNIDYLDWEIIIIDNGSNDGTKVFLKELSKKFGKSLKIILNSENLGYAAGVNQGIRISEGKYVLLLNNDVYILKNWLKSLINAIETSKECAIVGAKLIYPETCRIQHAGIVFIRKIEPLHIFKNCKMSDIEVNKLRFVDAVTGACMLIRRELFDEIGLFDENYKYGGFEDTDFCLRARIKGYKIIFSPKTIGIHDERVTTAQIGNYYKIFKRNYRVFSDKWARVLKKYNDTSLSSFFKLKMYFIYGLFKIIPKRLEFFIKKRLTTLFGVY